MYVGLPMTFSVDSIYLLQFIECGGANSKYSTRFIYIMLEIIVHI